MRVKTLWQVVRHSAKADLIIMDWEPRLVLCVCAAFLVFPFLRRPFLVNDIVLHKPKTLRHRFTAAIVRTLLTRVDHFTHYFRSLDGYEKYFGIGPDRSSYVPFKPNIRYRHSYRPNPDGEYVLCFGRSERDYDTFFRAMARLPYPAAIPTPDPESFRIHESRFTYNLSALPPNVKILDDTGDSESMIRIMERAHLVVLPIVAGRICASGIGTYLNAMLMGKCVIITEGPGVSDVLTGEALTVPTEDPEALACMIEKAWADDALRKRTAALGRRYAESCGGVAELCQRILDRALEKLCTPRQDSLTKAKQFSSRGAA